MAQNTIHIAWTGPDRTGQDRTGPDRTGPDRTVGLVLLHAMKGATVDHKLSVLVQMDLENRSVRLVVTGCVTEANQHVLYPLVRRARTLIPPVTVSVDLTTAGHVEAIAVDLLRWAIDHDEPVPGAGPVRILTPARLPGHPSAPARNAGLRKSARSLPA